MNRNGTYKAQIIGPMTGLPDYNRPAFAAAASRLRSLGYRVFNPGDWTDVPDPEALTWDDWMLRALEALDHADVAVLLPGRSASRGSRREFERAKERGLPMLDYGTGICRRQRGRVS